MGDVTGCTCYGAMPQSGRKVLVIKTPATADSANTLDVSDSTVTGGETLKTVDFVMAFDQTDNDVVTATVSSTTITIDAGGMTTNHTYVLLVVGQA